MVAGEVQQERGREGAYFAQAWLESTTRVSAPWIVYEASHMTTLTLLNGKHESWDVAGYFENDKRIFSTQRLRRIRAIVRVQSIANI